MVGPVASTALPISLLKGNKFFQNRGKFLDIFLLLRKVRTVLMISLKTPTPT